MRLLATEILCLLCLAVFPAPSRDVQVAVVIDDAIGVSALERTEGDVWVEVFRSRGDLLQEFPMPVSGSLVLDDSAASLRLCADGFLCGETRLVAGQDQYTVGMQVGDLGSEVKFPVRIVLRSEYPVGDGQRHLLKVTPLVGSAAETRTVVLDSDRPIVLESVRHGHYLVTVVSICGDVKDERTTLVPSLLSAEIVGIWSDDQVIRVGPSEQQ